MKMGCLFNGFFWGVLLIIIGVVILLNMVFKIDIPVFKLVVALVLIYWGIHLLTGITIGRRDPGPRTVSFGERTIVGRDEGDGYNIIFGQGTIRLDSVAIRDRTVQAEVNTVFGSSIVWIDPARPIKIKANSAFGEIRFPDSSSAVFGDHVYRSDSLDESKPHLLVKMSNVFGSTRVVNRAPAPDSAKGCGTETQKEKTP